MEVHEQRQRCSNTPLFVVSATGAVQNYHCPFVRSNQALTCVQISSKDVIAALLRARVPRHKCQRRSSNAFPIYATSRVAFVKTYLSPGKFMDSADGTLYPLPMVVRSQLVYSFVSCSDVVLSRSVTSLHRYGRRVPRFI